MTDATRTIIRAALAADNAVSDYERAQIEGALRGRVSALPDPDVRTYTAPEVARLLRVSIPSRLRTVCVNGATRICASSLAQLGV
jgi:hypothetical protein